MISHKPVLLNEAIKSLDIKSDGIYLDLTLGLGGHSKLIVSKLTTGKLICLDQDEIALEKAKQNLEEYSDKIIFVKSNFSQISKVLDDLKINYIDGALYDLGTSYYQLTSPSRGFSYQHQNLDMRMDLSSKLNAIDVLNSYSQEQLEYIFKTYGEVKFYKDLAKEIVLYRKENEITTTTDLNFIIDKFSKSGQNSNINNIYQAIRIEINNEFENLKESLNSLINYLKIGSVISIITFHSLEDKIVKSFFNQLKQQKEETVFETKFYYKTRKTIYSSKEEILENRASRSAKLRTLIKIYDK